MTVALSMETTLNLVLNNQCTLLHVNSKHPIQGQADLFFCGSYSEIFFELKAINNKYRQHLARMWHTTHTHTQTQFISNLDAVVVVVVIMEIITKFYVTKTPN